MHGPGETPRDEDSGAAPEAAPDAAPEAAAGAHNAADAAQAPPVEPQIGRPGGGLRVLAAAVMLPWLLGYGVIGTWTVVRGASGRSLRPQDVRRRLHPSRQSRPA